MNRKRGLNEDGFGDSDEEVPASDLPVPKMSSKTVELSVTKNSSQQTFMSRTYGDRDYSNMKLKPDHRCRPIWITEDGHIYLEAHSPIYNQARDFLIAIAEPLCRPEFIHEYKITAYSLYAAVSIGLITKDIIDYLERLCKTALPSSIKEFITLCTVSYGKVKLILKQNRYFVESRNSDIIQKLLKDSAIQTALVNVKNPAQTNVEQTILPSETVKLDDPTAPDATATKETEEFYKNVMDRGDEDDDAEAVRNLQILSFEIKADFLETVQKRCIELEYPLLAEYDFRNDEYNPNLGIDLKPTTSLRPYQEKSLRKMFGNSRARSGIIVLPCGAGKTLVGVTAATTINKRCLCLATSNVSVEQWRSQFKLWSTIQDSQIVRFTRETRDSVPTGADAEKPTVCVSTYSMVAYTGKRTHVAEEAMNYIRNHEWGLLLLDEVHTIPAKMFRRVLQIVKSHCKLGLTATLVREDDKITDLNFLIGPKLYEANWMELQAEGHIAKVQCAEVWCQMPGDYFTYYLTSNQSRRLLMAVMNPNKMRTCHFLIEYHKARGDKIIVFSDNVYALKKYALLMGIPFLFGGTSQAERMNILQNFQYNPRVSTILVSKVADTSFDLPEANVLIQVSSHGASRRQEAQRLGRILRAKKNTTDEFNAYFYSLVSCDTVEMTYSRKRQRFLINQGYAYKIVNGIPEMENANLVLQTQEQRSTLLRELLKVSDTEADEDDKEDEDDITQAKFHRRDGTMSSLSGANQMSYIGQSRKNDDHRHALFRKFRS